MRIEWTRPALSDLQQISDHIEQDKNLETANRVGSRIVEAVESLTTMPHRGRIGRRDGTRELIVPPYIAVYRVELERVAVIRVLHGKQRWP